MNRKPIIAVVGRPNVGKSTFVNRLVGRRQSIVDDMPGVTRDRIYFDVEWQNKKFTVIDTGGIVPGDEDDIMLSIYDQAKIACEEAEKIFNDAKRFIKPGMNCQDVYKFFQDETERKGFGYSWPKSCNPGVFSGYGCPGGHMGAPDFPIKKGSVVNVDFGIIVDGYSCDLQRMYYMLDDGEEDAPDDIKNAFYVIRDAIEMAAKALKPGTLGIDIDKIARDHVVNNGFAEYNCALGHPMGKVAHNGGPLLAPAKPRYDKDELIRTPLFENMVFTLEPGLETRAGHIGLEEDVVVKKDGAQFIVEPQRELYLIKEE